MHHATGFSVLVQHAPRVLDQQGGITGLRQFGLHRLITLKIQLPTINRYQCQGIDLLRSKFVTKGPVSCSLLSVVLNSASFSAFSATSALSGLVDPLNRPLKQHRIHFFSPRLISHLARSIPSLITPTTQQQIMPRGRRGCWTCRIRHRRCDESSPECKECSTRSITCHGYDLDPPEWMSNERLLQQELRRIKIAVKENFRRVKTIQNRQLARSTAQAAQASRAKATSRSGGEITQRPAQAGSSTTNTIFREAQYLVHYLDYIFPIQYAFYVDAPDQGGRGWLFFLLERSMRYPRGDIHSDHQTDAPLRNAALTLSAFHQHTFSPYHTENQEDELLQYHTKALQELRHVVRHRDVGASADNIEEWLKFLAGGMFLISFEV